MAEFVVSKLTKSYDRSERKVLNNFNLTIHDGDMTFLLGPSGCGKSTLLRILSGLLEPDSGSILKDGKDILNLPPEKRNMPMVFQNYALWPHMDVYDNIAFGLKNLKLKSSDIKKRIEEILETVQMSQFIHRSVPSLSGGEQQRIALARALAMNPDLLLLDEPLSNLDAKLRDKMRFEIRRICKERNITALYVTHDRKEALSMADQIAILENGAVSQFGPPVQVYQHPANRFAAAFLGDINFLDARFLNTAENGFAVYETNVGNIVAPCPSTTTPDKNYILAFRPESVVCEPVQNSQNYLHGKIQFSSFLGESTYHIISFPFI